MLEESIPPGLNETDVDDNTILHWAAHAGEADSCEIILSTEGFEGLAARNGKGQTAWQMARGQLQTDLHSAQAGP